MIRKRFRVLVTPAGTLVAACVGLLGDDTLRERRARRLRAMARRYQRQPVGEVFERLFDERAV